MKKSLFLFILIIGVFKVVHANTLSPSDYCKLYSDAVAREDYTGAFKISQDYLQAYQTTDACFLLGNCYMYGIGTEPNLEYTKQLYKAVYESPDISKASPLELRQEYAYCSRVYGGLMYQSKISAFIAENNITEEDLLDLDLSEINLKVEDFKPYFRAIEICNDPFSLFFIAYAYWCNLIPGDDDLIKDYLKKSASQNCIAAHALLGIIYSDEDDEDKAASHFSEAVSIPLYSFENSRGNEYFTNPNYELNPLVITFRDIALHEYAKILEDNEQLEEAGFFLNQMRIHSNLKRNNYAAEINLDLLNYDKAIEWADYSLTIDTNNTHALFYKGCALFYLNRYGESKSILNKAISLGDKKSLEFYNTHFLSK